MNTTVTCPRCQKGVTPQLVQAQSGLISRFCPLCSASLEGLAGTDVSQVRVSSKWGFIALGVVVALFVAGAFASGLF